MKLPDLPFLKTLGQSQEERALQRARALSEQGKPDKALSVLETALSQIPHSEPLLFEAALQYLLVSRKNEAGGCLKKILLREPKQIHVAQEFVEAVKMRVSDVGTFRDAITEHHIRRNDHRAALDTLSRIPVEELRIYQARHLKRWDGARKRSAQSRLSESQVHSAYYVALALECQNDFTGAAQAYRALFETNPDEASRICARLEAVSMRDYHNLSLRLSLADLLLEIDKVSEALAHLEQALLQDPQGAAPEVAKRLHRYLEARPGEAGPLWLLLRSHRASAAYPEMLQVMRQLREQDSHQKEVIRLLSEMTREMEQNPELRLALAEAYLATGKPNQAVEVIVLASEKLEQETTRRVLERVIAAYPDHPRALLLLGDLDLRIGHTERGVERFERVLRLSPEEGSVLVSKLLGLLEKGVARGPLAACLARIFTREKDWERVAVLLRYRIRHQEESAAETAELVRAALAVESSHPGLRIARAEALLLSGGAIEATSVLAELLREQPGRAAEALHTLSAAARHSAEAARAALPVYRECAKNDTLAPAAWFGLGEAALSAGEMKEAVSAFLELAGRAPERMTELRETLESLLTRYPEAVEVRYLLVRTYLEQGDYHAAAAELRLIERHDEDQLAPLLARWEKALSRNPENIDLRIGLSAILVRSRNFKRVRANATETLRMADDERTAFLHLDLGDTCLEDGDSSAAIKRYFNAWRKDSGLAPEAKDRLEHLIRLHPNSGLASLAIGKILCSAGQLADGLTRLLEAFQAQPQLAEQVLGELERVCGAHPGYGEALSARIRVLSALGRDRKVVEAIQSHLVSHPDSAGDWIPTLEAILTRDPDHPDAHLALALAHGARNEIAEAARACACAYRADRGRAPRIVRICAELTAKHPHVAAPYLTMAEVFLSDGELPAATEKLFQAAMRTDASETKVLGLLEEVLKRDPDTARVAHLAAEVLSRYGRHATAVCTYQKCLERNPDTLESVISGYGTILAKDASLGEAHLARAQAHCLRHAFDDAVQDLEMTLRLKPSLSREILNQARPLRERIPEHQPLTLLLSDLLLLEGEMEEAGRILEEQLERPLEPQARFALLLRRWRVLLAQGRSVEARRVLADLLATTGEPRQLLEQIHEDVLTQLQVEANRLQGRIEEGDYSPEQVMELASRLMMLGETDRALGLTSLRSGVLKQEGLLKIHSGAAVLKSDFFRAAEILKPLGPSRQLAHALIRSGDYLLACRTLEELTATDPDPGLKKALQSAYRLLVLQDLTPKGERLMGETVLRFGNQN